MKFLTFKFIVIFIYVISSSITYAIQEPNFKNLIVHKVPIKLEEISFKNSSKDFVTLNDYKNFIIILNFWATWCAPCKEEMPSLNRLQSNKSFYNLKILPINVGQESILRAQEFFDQLRIDNLEVYIDDTVKTANQFSLRGLPTTILINKKGEEFARILGAIDFDNEKFIEWLKNYD